LEKRKNALRRRRRVSTSTSFTVSRRPDAPTRLASTSHLLIISLPQPKAPSDPARRRSSSRIKGLQSDGMYVIEERARGGGGAGSRIRVAAPNADAARAGACVEVVPEDTGPTERHPGGEVPFKSENGMPGMDEAFLGVLCRAAAAGEVKEEKKGD